MIIIAGAFEVDPSERDEFIAGRAEQMRTSRSEAGCLEYVVAPDPLESGRVVLFERWASKEDLAAHLTIVRSQPRPSGAPTALKSDLVQYEIAATGAIGS